MAEVSNGSGGVAIHVVPFVKDGDRCYVFCREDLKVDDVSLLKVVVRNNGTVSDYGRFAVYGKRRLADSGEEEVLETLVGRALTSVGVGPVEVEGRATVEVLVKLRSPFQLVRLDTALLTVQSPNRYCTSALDFDLVDVRVGGESQLVTAEPMSAQYFVGGAPLYAEEASPERPLTLVVSNCAGGTKTFRAVLVGEVARDVPRRVRSRAGVPEVPGR